MAEIRCLLNQTVEISKQQAAVIDDNRIVTYEEFEVYVTTMAHHLRERGIGDGERVAILMHPSWEQIALMLALIRVKAVACPLSHRLPPAAVKAHMSQVQAVRLISDVEERPDGLEVVDPADLLPFVQGMERPKVSIDLDQPAVVVFTSGSGGKPKPAVLSYGALYYSARGSNIHLHLRSNEKWLLSIPMYHVGGLGVIFRCLEAGATMVVAKPGEKLQEQIELYQATHVSLVPTQLYRLLALRDAKEVAASLTTVLLGGAPAAPERIRQALVSGYPVHATYGLTEMGSQVTTCPKYFPPEKIGSSGTVLPNRELMISADGEILVRGQTLFQGYIEGDEVVLPVDDDGWFATGDLGRLDEDGYLFVEGRKDAMFISGGENIHPEEIEQVLLDQPDVDQAVVVPREDPEFGHRPVAYLQGDAVAQSEQLLNRLEEFLPRFKIPVEILPWPEDAPQSLKIDRAWFLARA